MSLTRQVILSPARLRAFPGLAEEAIHRALESARGRIETVALTETPFYTGRLAASFKILKGPRSLIFAWDAVDPESGFAYADVVDKGRTGGTILMPKQNRPNATMMFPRPWKGGGFVYYKGPLEQGGFAARNYSDRVHQEAVRIMLEELEREFLAIGG